ncbi:MAG: carbon-nitrogen hydrolase family protein [Nitriliruptoraceae bacterium]
MTWVGVCQLGGDDAPVERAWARLCDSAATAPSEVLVLPEMCFAPWLAASPRVSATAWDEAVAAHEMWLARLHELGAAVVVTSVPVIDEGRRYNEAVVWVAGQGIVARRRKTFLPDEPGFYEASWYERGPVSFESARTPLATLGVLVCTEVWFGEHARGYGRHGVELLAVPRATPFGSLHRWEAACRVAAINAGAYCLSSNRSGSQGEVTFGGGSWIISPEGEILARTTADAPIATVAVDLEAAATAKRTYPRYVDDSPPADNGGPVQADGSG